MSKSAQSKRNVPVIIKNTFDDIVNIKIQGATNVAIETFKAVQTWAKQYKGSNTASFLAELEKHTWTLAEARPNEPLAKNGARFLAYKVKEKKAKSLKIDKAMALVTEIVSEYLDLLQNAKKKVIKYGLEHDKLNKVQNVFTHCHSSTAENLIKGLHKRKPVKVIATETRPLYQGRITAKNLLDAGLDVTMIVDSAGPYFIKDDSQLPVDVLFLGADEITVRGDVINKVGSFSHCLAAYFASKPVYVVTPALKLDLSTLWQPPQIEMREAKEIWPEAPSDLKIINPAFDLINHRLIQGIISELGVHHPDEFTEAVGQAYPWLQE